MRRLVVSVALASCGLFPNVEGLSGDASTADVGDASMTSDASDAGDAAPDVAADSGCVGIAGPTPMPAGTYCIDSTEVTVNQYQAFLATKPPLSLIPSCAFKITHAPDVTPPNGHGDYPITWIDWCDAYDYCVWAGKHLCGTPDGGALDNAFLNTADDAWFLACSLNGTYPYGNTYDPNACSGPERDAGEPLPASSLPACVGGYPGVYNLVGNVDEWANSCTPTTLDGGTTASDQCLRRSGSFSDPVGVTQVCAFNRSSNRNSTDNDVGFRCCSDRH